MALVSKLHQLGQNQTTLSSALDIVCSLIFCVRRERWFNRERGRQDFCPFAPFSKYSTELSCKELSFAVASLRALLGKRSVAVWRCIWLWCVYCFLSALSLLSRRARNYCPAPHYCHFFFCFHYKLQSEVEKPLLNFRENFKKDMKKCDHHIADLRKHLASRYAAVEKVGAENKLESLWDTAGLDRKAAAPWKVSVLPQRTTKVSAECFLLLVMLC